MKLKTEAPMLSRPPEVFQNVETQEDDCLSTCVIDGARYYCTLQEDHDGDHQAEGSDDHIHAHWRHTPKTIPY